MRKVGSHEARQTLRKLIDDAQHHGIWTLITKRGEPVAVLGPADGVEVRAVVRGEEEGAPKKTDEEAERLRRLVPGGVG